MKHRITILNHDDTHNTIISKLSKTSLQLTSNFTREDRFTYDLSTDDVAKFQDILDSFNVIKELNIRIGKVSSPVFTYHTKDMEINVVPSAKEYEFTQGTEKLWQQLGIDSKKWIHSRSSLMINQDISHELRSMVKKLTGMAFEGLNLVYYDNTLVISLINNDESADEAIKTITWQDGVYTETGIFLIDDFEVNDVVLSGLRVIMDGREPRPEDDDDEVHQPPTSMDHLHKTLFHIKPKYRDYNISTSLEANGLHPKLKFQFPLSPLDNDVKDCQPFYYVSLPKHLFIDPYNPGTNVEIVVNYGTTDLELPEYSINEWGHQLLVHLTNETAELNLHTRYQLPNSDEQISINGVSFYGCDLNDRNTLVLNPFLNYNLGSYQSFFTNDTVFYQNFHHDTMDIPNPKSEFYGINLITLVTIILGSLIVGLQLLKPRSKRDYRKPTVKGKK